MAEKKTRIPRDNFIAQLVKDPKQPPDVLMLTGFLGDSSEEGHTRLYFDAQLSGYVEIPDAAIVHTQELPKDQSPLGGSYVWIQRDAELVHGKVGPTRTRAKFFEGQIYQDFLRGAQFGTAAGQANFAAPTLQITACALCNTNAIGCNVTPNCTPPTTPNGGCFVSVAGWNCPTDNLRCVPSVVNVCPSWVDACPTNFPGCNVFNTFAGCNVINTGTACNSAACGLPGVDQGQTPVMRQPQFNAQPQINLQSVVCPQTQFCPVSVQACPQSQFCPPTPNCPVTAQGCPQTLVCPRTVGLCPQTVFCPRTEMCPSFVCPSFVDGCPTAPAACDVVTIARCNSIACPSNFCPSVVCNSMACNSLACNSAACGFPGGGGRFPGM